MADFINTIDALGDDVVIDSIIQRTITEFKDDVITKVDNGAFNECDALTAVELPNVTTVEDNAFRKCTAIETISLAKCAYAGVDSFSYMSSLRVCDMPEVREIARDCFAFSFTADTVPCFPKATKIGARAFRDSPVSIIDLPACTTLQGIVFYCCTNLIALILRNTETVCTADNANPFAGNYSGTNGPIAKGEGYIYVPAALVDSYKAATNWSTYAAQFRALEDYTVDGTTTGALDETKI